MNDLELLKAYVRDASEPAFAELARRYVPMVYSSALRQVRSPQDAEDVTQAVFLLLSRKARGLSDSVVVAAWLLRAAHFASRSMLRGQSRRRRHETKAITMTTKSQGEEAGTGSSTTDWEKVAPLLDEAIATLGEAARDALVLRFFRNKSYHEVAERLAIAEPAARQRVSRGVDQLRKYFSRRGIVLSATGLEAMVVANAVHPAPKLLAGLVTGLASKGAVVTARHAALAKGASIGMVPVMTKLVAAACVIFALGAGGFTLYRAHRGTISRESQASQVQPVMVAASVDAGPIRGRVLDSSGRPVSGAEVMLARVSAAVSIYGPTHQGVLTVSTRSDGDFEFPAMPDATAVVARSDAGIAQLRLSDLRAGRSLQLVPWGRIEGRLSVGSAPVRRQVIELSRTNGSLEEWNLWHVMHGSRTRTDSRGRFVFEHVLPTVGNSVIGVELRWQLPSAVTARTQIVRVPPGQVAHIELGGTGRPIVGRIAAPAGQPGFTGNMYPEAPAPQPLLAESSPPVFPIDVQPDGSFRAEDVPAGKYWLTIVSLQKVRNLPLSEVLASAGTQVVVPEMPGGRSDQPLDVGKLIVSLNPVLRVGEPAPDFVAAGADGRAIRLTDYKGKYLLLYLPAPGQDSQWVRPSALQAIHDRFGDQTGLAMLEVKVDVPLGNGPRGAAVERRPWIVATANPPGGTTRPTTSPAPTMPWVYVSSATGLFLIGPNGKCVARNLSGREALSMLADLLPRPAASSAKLVIDVEHRPPTKASQTSAQQPILDAGHASLATAAKWAVVDGQVATSSGGLGVLNDSRLASNDDDPSANFFFDFGTLEGRFRVGFEQPVAIAQIKIYSRHRSHRAPQVYALYGCDGLSPNFNPSPKIGVDPASCGWTKIADVDTRPPSGPDGGQYLVTLKCATGPIGKYRHILCLAFATETEDEWGQTFFSEIQLLQQEGRP